MGAFQCYVILWGWGCVRFRLFRHYEDVRSNIYTIILLKSLSVDVIKLQVTILARSSREMCQTVRID